MITNVFLKSVLVPHIARNNQRSAVLFLDSAPCHKKVTVRQCCDKNRIRLQFIPPRFTSLLQPADEARFSELKRAYHQKWTDWYLNDERTFTKSGNIRSPGYAKVQFFINSLNI